MTRTPNPRTPDGRPYVSPSEIETHRRCAESWRLSYLERDRPPGAAKSAVLGSLVHWEIEASIRGVDPLAELPSDVWSRLVYWATVESTSRADVEDTALDLWAHAYRCAGLLRVMLPLHLPHWPEQRTLVRLHNGWLMVVTDLLTQAEGVVGVHDYKTTGKRRQDDGSYVVFGYQKDRAALEGDTQCQLNCAAALVRFPEALAVDVSWHYIATSTTNPQYAVTSFRSSPADVMRRATPTLEYAEQLLQLHHEHDGALTASGQFGAPEVLDIEDPSSPCHAFGGCRHHPDRGGKCRLVPARDLARMIARSL